MPEQTIIHLTMACNLDILSTVGRTIPLSHKTIPPMYVIFLLGTSFGFSAFTKNLAGLDIFILCILK